MINTINLPPFKRMCVTIGNLPSSFMESMSYYEALCWMYNYLDKTVIPAINTEGEAITELQTAFTTLKTYVDNYFDNLDVQEEINNKLDAMAESGELTEIIAQYLTLNGILSYNTVSDLVEATNIVDGSTAKTLGHTSVGDGGGALYKIREITNSDVVDNMTILALDDENLVAELINNNVNVKQLGATVNTDITDYIEKSIEKYGYANIPSGTYKCNVEITDDINAQIIGHNTILKPDDSDKPVIKILCDEIIETKEIKDIKLELTGSETGIKISKPAASNRDGYYPQRVILNNINVFVTSNYTGNVIDLEYLSEINISGVYVKRERLNDDARTGTGIKISSCVNLNLYNSSFGFLNKGVEILTNNKTCEGITLNNVELIFNNYGVTATAPSSYSILNLRIMNCMIDQVQVDGVVLDGVTTSSIINNWIGVNVANSTGIKLLSTNHENYGTIISDNTIWLLNKTASYPIYIKRNASYNIRNTNISGNTIFNYNLKAIFLDDTNAISYLRINNNHFETSSSESANTPLAYGAVPSNCIISNCSNGGGFLRIAEDIIVKNCVGIVNTKMFTESDITVGSNAQNTANNTLKLCITASASGGRGYVAVSIGASNATIEQKYTQAIEQGGQGVIYVTVPTKYWYNITTTSAITINKIYGSYN